MHKATIEVSVTKKPQRHGRKRFASVVVDIDDDNETKTVDDLLKQFGHTPARFYVVFVRVEGRDTKLYTNDREYLSFVHRCAKQALACH
jgi:hypothetical protein